MRLWAVAVWLLLWQAASMSIGQEILLVSPLSVLRRLGELAFAPSFLSTVGFSLVRICGGFFLAVAAGTVLAGLAAAFRPAEDLFAPVMAAVKAVPVASFIILVLMFIPSRNLSVVVSFLIALPVIYANVLSGLRHMDRELLEMAWVFRLPPGRRLRYIYLPQVFPFFRTGCSLALGLCWKAGVAGEVIGIPAGSVGEKLYQAKVYLETPDLFAWTLVIVAASLLFERLFLSVLDAGWEKMKG